ncbi:MAG: 50S ribosomal protein L10 [candidate division Zixibacteria bacterium]|nr:50S ribosomal protein L10 [candidate division Zixibacteria bacterium]
MAGKVDMPTKEKENQIALLKERFADANSVIVTDHTGINVADMTVLRRDLRNSNAEFRVAKNTLLRIAAKESDLEDIAEYFVGPTSMVFGFDDPSIPAKVIHDFSKKTDIPKVKAFILDNQLLTVEDYKKIALLPSKNEVLAMVIGAVEGPITGFVMTLDGVTRNFIGLLDALAEERK